MKKLLTILFTLYITASFAQVNYNSVTTAYQSLSQVLKGHKNVGFRFDVIENGRVSHFVVAKRSASVVPDGGMIIALADSVNAAIRDVDASDGVNILWFGGKGDFNPLTNTGTDNYPIIIKALAALKSGNPTTLGFPTPKLFFPAGNYYISKQLDIKKTIWFEGEGSNYTLQSTLLTFGQDQNGFIFNRTNTPVGTTNRRGSDGSVLKHLTITQVQPSHYGNAITMPAGISMEDCTVSTWGGWGGGIIAGVASTTDKSIRNILMNDVGDSFHAVPTVNITDLKGTGSGATATAVLGGKIWKYVLVDSGRGYVRPPKIRVGVKPESITEATVITTGMGGAAKAIMGVDSITVTSGGNGYTWAVIRPSDSLRKGSAKFHAVIVGGVITGVVIDSSGGGGNSDNVYDTTFTAENGIIIDSSGEGYSSLPKLYIDGNGTGATAVANTLKVVGIGFLQPGWGYETDTVSLYFMGTRLNNKGRMATGYALVNPNTKFVKRVIITNAGSNYDSVRITFSGGTPSSNAYAQALRGIDKLGNANLFRMVNVRFYRCSYGVYTDGTDANAGVFEYCRFNENRLWGAWEHGFLGNGYNNPLFSGNKAGAFAATNNTAWQAVFVNVYTESGQPASVAVNPVRINGGSNGTPYYGNSTHIDAVNNAISKQTGYVFTEKGTINDQTISLGGDVDKKQVLSVY
jgi:hypothetical protein